MVMGKPQKSVRDRIRQRPVRVAGVVLSLLLWALAVIPGEEPAIVVQVAYIAAPLIAAWITERFTFSQAFLKQVLQWMDEFSGPTNGVSDRVRRSDPRLARASGLTHMRRYDAGVTAIEAVLVVFVIVVIFLLLRGRI